MSTNEKGTPQSRTYTVNDIADILGIGRASAYKLANSGLFKTIRIGNMIRISRKFFEDWLKMGYRYDLQPFPWKTLCGRLSTGTVMFVRLVRTSLKALGKNSYIDGFSTT